MGTKNNPGLINCYAAAEPDEPIFILRSTDKSAPITVKIWAELYKTRKKELNEWNNKSEQKYIEALVTADDMEIYYNTNIKK